MDILDLVRQKREARAFPVDDISIEEEMWRRHTYPSTRKSVEKIFSQMEEMGYRKTWDENFFAAIAEYNRRFSFKRMGWDPTQTDFTRRYRTWKQNTPKFTVREIGYNIANGG